jgi:hypothetical protein
MEPAPGEDESLRFMCASRLFCTSLSSVSFEVSVHQILPGAEITGQSLLTADAFRTPSNFGAFSILGLGRNFSGSRERPSQSLTVASIEA